jgi:phage terminase small subunit
MGKRKIPEKLCKEAKEFYEFVLENWELRDEELTTLEVAVYSLNRYHQARKILDREGLIVKTGTMPRKHPAIEVEKISRAGFLSALKQLGLKPPPEKPEIGRPPRGY